MYNSLTWNEIQFAAHSWLKELPERTPIPTTQADVNEMDTETGELLYVLTEISDAGVDITLTPPGPPLLAKAAISRLREHCDLS